MHLILIRHAQAEPMDPKLHADDAARPLTRKGKAVHKKIAAALKRMGHDPHCIVTSPKLRARKTAEITARAFKLKRALEVHPALGDAYAPAVLIRLLRRFRDKTVICVGHEPDLSHFAGLLIGAKTASWIKLETSGVLVIYFDSAVGIDRGALFGFYNAADLLRVL